MVRRKAQGEERGRGRLRQLHRPRILPALRIRPDPKGWVRQEVRDPGIRMPGPWPREEIRSPDRNGVRFEEDTDLKDHRVPVPPFPVPQLDLVGGIEHERRFHRALPHGQAVFGRRWHTGGHRLRGQGLDR